MPSISYGEDMAIEIERLELLGESIIKHLFLLGAITD
jgi:hypothetical protein